MAPAMRGCQPRRTGRQRLSRHRAGQPGGVDVVVAPAATGGMAEAAGTSRNVVTAGNGRLPLSPPTRYAVLPITPAAALATGTGRCPTTWMRPGAGRGPGDGCGVDEGAWADDGMYWKTRLLVLSRADGLAVPDRPAAWAVWPPATKIRPPRVKPVACASGAGRCPTTVARPLAGSTRWMSLVMPDGVCPPNTQIRDPSAATAGYR